MIPIPSPIRKAIFPLMILTVVIIVVPSLVAYLPPVFFTRSNVPFGERFKHWGCDVLADRNGDKKVDDISFVFVEGVSPRRPASPGPSCPRLPFGKKPRDTGDRYQWRDDDFDGRFEVLRCERSASSGE